ncbi:uncharacterized protein TRUGW13939_07677 [Talaromyces rugulosus]|uniref:Uncharacterized protein n=1 Tax=Talaromyces rugulosus TaxID=121627 RepID=A0A7H8R2H1_TALRU|nr:uncharacterized protein TRUGW13939_07677 [Talaromyces rugulosus]QKX60532.1 hypothetical protein TRUGW13939_07677 [Talaromyces rugulosus]
MSAEHDTVMPLVADSGALDEQQLVNFGRRRGAKFLGSPIRPPYPEIQMFGLQRLDKFITAINSPELRIPYLRRKTTEMTDYAKPSNWIIVYKDPGLNEYCLTTALTEKSDHHQHWKEDIVLLHDWKLSFNGYEFEDNETTHPHDELGIHPNTMCIQTISLNSIGDNSHESKSVSSLFEHRYEPEVEKDFIATPMEFRLVIGDRDTGGLYLDNQVARRAKHADFESTQRQEISHSTIVEYIDEKKLALDFMYSDFVTDSILWKPLQVLGTAVEIYKGIPAPNISMEVINHPIVYQQWATQTNEWNERRDNTTQVRWYQIRPITRTQAF